MKARHHFVMLPKDASNYRPPDYVAKVVQRDCNESAPQPRGFGVGDCQYPDCSCHNRREHYQLALKHDETWEEQMLQVNDQLREFMR